MFDDKQQIKNSRFAMALFGWAAVCLFVLVYAPPKQIPVNPGGHPAKFTEQGIPLGSGHHAESAFRMGAGFPPAEKNENTNALTRALSSKYYSKASLLRGNLPIEKREIRGAMSEAARFVQNT